VNNHLRILVDESRSDEEKLRRTLLEARDFLRASRIHGVSSEMWKDHVARLEVS
jgi:hypothetical protein